VWAPNNTAPPDIPQWPGAYDQSLGAEAMPTVVAKLKEIGKYILAN
jgi:hypothetical protein